MALIIPYQSQAGIHTANAGPAAQYRSAGEFYSATGGGSLAQGLKDLAGGTEKLGAVLFGEEIRKRRETMELTLIKDVQNLQAEAEAWDDQYRKENQGNNAAKAEADAKEFYDKKIAALEERWAGNNAALLYIRKNAGSMAVSGINSMRDYGNGQMDSYRLAETNTQLATAQKTFLSPNSTEEDRERDFGIWSRMHTYNLAKAGMPPERAQQDIEAARQGLERARFDARFKARLDSGDIEGARAELEDLKRRSAAGQAAENEAGQAAENEAGSAGGQAGEAGSEAEAGAGAGGQTGAGAGAGANENASAAESADAANASTGTRTGAGAGANENASAAGTSAGGNATGNATADAGAGGSSSTPGESASAEAGAGKSKSGPAENAAESADASNPGAGAGKNTSGPAENAAESADAASPDQSAASPDKDKPKTPSKPPLLSPEKAKMYDSILNDRAQKQRVAQKNAQIREWSADALDFVKGLDISEQEASATAWLSNYLEGDELQEVLAVFNKDFAIVQKRQEALDAGLRDQLYLSMRKDDLNFSQAMEAVAGLQGRGLSNAAAEKLKKELIQGRDTETPQNVRNTGRLLKLMANGEIKNTNEIKNFALSNGLTKDQEERAVKWFEDGGRECFAVRNYAKFQALYKVYSEGKEPHDDTVAMKTFLYFIPEDKIATENDIKNAARLAYEEGETDPEASRFRGRASFIQAVEDNKEDEWLPKYPEVKEDRMRIKAAIAGKLEEAGYHNPSENQIHWVYRKVRGYPVPPERDYLSRPRQVRRRTNNEPI